MKMLTRLVLAACLVVVSTSAARAHGVWTAERWGQLGVIYGHGAEDGPYDPAKIKSVAGINAKGEAVDVKVNAAENHATLAAGDDAAAILIIFDNGFYSKAPDGTWVNKGKSEVPGATESGQYIKYNVSVIKADGALPSLPAQPLQIVPLTNPATLEHGKSFKVRVLFNGKPLPGVEIIPDYVNASEAHLGKSDLNGEAEVFIRNDGLNVVAVSHTASVADNPDADSIGHFATLSFVAKHAHEH